MALTEFGKAVRKARLDCDQTLADMASALSVTPAFLSSVETGRKKVPEGLASQVSNFFSVHGVRIHNLQALADVSNQSVSLEGLDPNHQMLVAGFARSSLDAETLGKLAELLKVCSAKGEAVIE